MFRGHIDRRRESGILACNTGNVHNVFRATVSAEFQEMRDR